MILGRSISYPAYLSAGGTLAFAHKTIDRSYQILRELYCNHYDQALGHRNKNFWYVLAGIQCYAFSMSCKVTQDHYRRSSFAPVYSNIYSSNRIYYCSYFSSGNKTYPKARYFGGQDACSNGSLLA